MSVIKGGDLMLFVTVGTSKKSIGYATNHTLSISAETTETSTKDNGGVWSMPEVSTLSWTASTENLCGDPAAGTTYNDLVELMVAREAIEAVFALEGDSTDYVKNKLQEAPANGWKPKEGNGYKGKVVITNVEINAPNGDNATFTVEFTGVGKLEILKKN